MKNINEMSVVVTADEMKVGDILCRQQGIAAAIEGVITAPHELYPGQWRVDGRSRFFYAGVTYMVIRGVDRAALPLDSYGQIVGVEFDAAR